MQITQPSNVVEAVADKRFRQGRFLDGREALAQLHPASAQPLRSMANQGILNRRTLWSSDRLRRPDESAGTRSLLTNLGADNRIGHEGDEQPCGIEFRALNQFESVVDSCRLLVLGEMLEDEAESLTPVRWCGRNNDRLIRHESNSVERRCRSAAPLVRDQFRGPGISSGAGFGVSSGAGFAIGGAAL